MVWKIISAKVALSDINANPNGKLCPPSWPTGRSTWLPFGTRTLALAPLVSPSTPSWTPRHPRTRPAPPHSLCLSLSRVSDGRGDIAIAPSASWAPRALSFASHRITSPGVSEFTSTSAFFSTSWLPEISPRWAAFLKFSVVGFAAVVTPTPANLAAAPSLPPFFCLSHIRACLGHRRGLCHTIPSLVAPSSGNTAVVPPCSPPTTTLHVSRLTGAVRVRPFYLGSSALSHWCLSRPSPMLYWSEMAGVSRDSSIVPPWPTATSFCCSRPWTTYLYRRGMTQGARWCPWIHRRSSSSASICRRVCSLFVLYVADTRVPLSLTQRFPPLFYSNSRFCAILQKSYLQFLSSENCETSFVMIHGMASF